MPKRDLQLKMMTGLTFTLLLTFTTMFTRLSESLLFLTIITISSTRVVNPSKRLLSWLLALGLLDITPVVHYSESKTIHQGGDKATPAHSDLVYGPIAFYDNTVDVMIEVKA